MRFKYGQEEECQNYIDKIKRTHDETKNFIYQSDTSDPNTYDEDIYNAAVDYITDLDSLNASDFYVAIYIMFFLTLLNHRF